MKKRKTWVSLLLLTLVTALVVTACSTGGNNNSNNDNKSGNNRGQQSQTNVNQPADNEEIETLPPYEVVMVYPDGMQRDLEMVQTAMNDHLKANYPELNMTVKLNPVEWGAWGDKTNLMMASNEKFDTIFTASWLGFDNQVNKGALLPLDELLAKYGEDIEKVEKDYHGGAVRGGKLYGIHTHQELGGMQGIVVRKDLAEKYNFDLNKLAETKNLADLEPLLQTIKENEPGITPMVGVPFPMEAYFRSGKMELPLEPFGLQISKNDFNIVSYYETDEYIEMAKLIYKWAKLGYINKDGSNTDGVNGWDKIKAGTGFAVAGADMEIVADNTIPALMPNRSKEVGMELIQIPLNHDPLRSIKLAGTLQAISATSEDPERAMMLINLFFKDKELLTLFNFGIEGTHYVLKDGQVDLPEGKTTDNVGFYHDIMWQIGNQMLNLTRVGEDPNKYKNYESFNQLVAANPSPILGFVFDSEPVKNEIVAIGNVRQTYDPGFNAGLLNPETDLPKLLEKLKAAGSEKVRAEMQRQLDEWRAANGK
jgi:putative aldouronate transport system substrate-binding protein